MNPDEYAEVQYDKEVTQWKVVAGGGQPMEDEHGAPRYWMSFSAALDVRDRHNKALYRGGRWGSGY